MEATSVVRLHVLIIIVPANIITFRNRWQMLFLGIILFFNRILLVMSERLVWGRFWDFALLQGRIIVLAVHVA